MKKEFWIVGGLGLLALLGLRKDIKPILIRPISSPEATPESTLQPISEPLIITVRPTVDISETPIIAGQHAMVQMINSALVINGIEIWRSGGRSSEITHVSSGMPTMVSIVSATERATLHSFPISRIEVVNSDAIGGYTLLTYIDGSTTEVKSI